MSDDGLLLNFTTAPRAPQAAAEAKKAPIASSGAYRDRPVSGGVRKERSSTLRGPRSRKSTQARNGQLRDEPKSAGNIASLFTSNPDVSANMVPTSGNSDAISPGVGTNAPLSDNSAFALNNPTLSNFVTTKMGLSAPTQVQRSAIPAILQSDNDIVMVAQTGSGKTLAYLLPIFAHLMNMPERITRQSGIFAVILAPTRELATQIFNVCEQICRCCHYIVPGLVIGGEKKKSEKARLRKGVNILVGTPGRMADHVEHTRRLELQRTQFVVLDEGDRLIDMGFEETVTEILSKIPESRRTILCSATMNTQAARLKTLTLRDPVCWVREEQQEVTPGQLVQRISVVPTKLRLVTLAATLRTARARNERAIVFFSCTDSVDFHFRIFSTCGKDGCGPVFRLHGGMSQQQRAETMTEFVKAVKQSVAGATLLTTDVASRGIDTTVDIVVEYDPPFTIEDHLHRAGRTARAGKKGEALLFLLPSEEAYAEKIKGALTGSVQLDTYQRILQRGFGSKEWMDRATAWQLNVEKTVLDDNAELAKKAFTAHVRAYATHSSSERDIFSVRALHLGHLAKAFALREAPSSIAGGTPSKKTKKLSPKQAMLAAAQRQMEVDEFHVINST